MSDSMSRPQVGFTGAKSHPLYQEIGHVCERYRRQAAAFFQAYADLKYAAEWAELEPVELPEDASATPNNGSEGHTEAAPCRHSRWALIRGKRRGKNVAEYVVPCSLADTLNVESFTQIFQVVYYQLAKGLVKPIN
ncbi:hypothetical protein K437DRAFT_166073 [Tilletiaria anomala UBC 951]|uniref:Uncharacterized protein n=1 Tax=Tilletiaria anomala (strain ATCC 24038 / CBS 436.72 / UBC 951) TaxID=1037660 RepID=A0A066VUC8_TILAU|nr:uncharacterized protein K437DRAFT_166073 [Tilletiaria anomala UBC 951]KDN42180.1 hypothetical protein K437DRAFT_166073 [Tilletiaria anomala UBC 951]